MMMPKQKPVNPAPPMAPELRAREPEVRRPAGQDAAANAEPDAGGENGQEAGPQQTIGVRRDRFVA